MPTDTNVNSLVINKLTKAQYDAIQSPSETELYLVEEETEKEDETIIEPTSASALTAEVGKYYRFDTPVETIAITLPTMTGVTSVKTISFYMTGGTTPAVTFTSTHNIIKSKGFEIEANGVYEINAAWNGIGWIIGQLTLEAE